MNENGQLKKEMLHQQVQIQELQNLRSILEEQIAQKGQQHSQREAVLEQENNRLRQENDGQR